MTTTTTTTILPPSPLFTPAPASTPFVGFTQLLHSLGNSTVKSADSVFKCIAEPPLTLDQYAERLAQFFRASPEAFVVSAVIAKRLHSADPSLFCARSLHKIMAGCLVVGLKFHDDKYYTNAFYAQCAGVPTEDLNAFEVAVLRTLDFSVFVSDEEFRAVAAELEQLERDHLFAQKCLQHHRQALVLGDFAQACSVASSPAQKSAWEYHHHQHHQHQHQHQHHSSQVVGV